MVSFIVLPPLQSTTLSASTPVTVFHAGQTALSPLGAALTQFSKAVIALHPVDAPVHAVTLPPLPAQRRDAALRVKLEDVLLSDTAQLTLAVDALGKHQFAVGCVSTALLASVLASLRVLGHGNCAVVALASHLPPNQEHTLNGWTLWRDAQGAGAAPITEGSSIPALAVNNLSPKLSPFTQTQASGASWQRWRWAALLAVLCGLVYLTGLWLHSRQLLALELQANRATVAAFQSAMPNTPIIDPVKQLQAASKGSNALTAALASIPADWPQGMVTQLSWANKRLSITVSPASMKLNEAQQKQLTDTLAAKNIALTWSKP